MPLYAELVGAIAGEGTFQDCSVSKSHSVSQPRTQTMETAAHCLEGMTEAMRNLDEDSRVPI